jgi:gliding motility-associated-like protein
VPDPDSTHTYRWFLDNQVVGVEPSSVHTYYESGTYMLEFEVTDMYGCVYSTFSPVVLVDMLDLTGFFLPNIITPNGDDFNDVFEVPGTVGECLDYSIQFFNRWGDQIYSMTPTSEAFSGKNSGGTELPDGVYYYLFTVERFECSTTPELKSYCSGTVQVKRE